jgi:capsular exopolysaccharide synthesis family protein
LEKISVALERILERQEPSERLFGAVDAAAAANQAPTRPPGRITYTRTRTLEVLPEVLERHRVASLRNDRFSDPFRLLRTQVLMHMRQHGLQTLAVTSPNRGAGKSTVALNLAMSFALEADCTALLVDADLRDPDLRHLLELEPGPGLVDYLLGRAALEDLLIHPNVGNLVVLPGGEPVANSSELLRSPMMADLIRELRARYRDRFIVFDVPPILVGADTLALSAFTDATILLVEECKTRRADIARSCELLGNSNLLGIVLNKSRQLPEPEPLGRPKPGFFRRILGGEG